MGAGFRMNLCGIVLSLINFMETSAVGKVDGEDNEKPTPEKKKEPEAAEDVNKEEEKKEDKEEKKEDKDDDEEELMKEIMAREGLPGEISDEDGSKGEKDGEDGVEKKGLGLEIENEEDRNSEEKEDDDETMKLIMGGDSEEEGEDTDQNERQEESQSDKQPNAEEAITAQPEVGSKETEESQKEEAMLPAEAETKGIIEEMKETPKEKEELKKEEEEEEDDEEEVKEEPVELPAEEVKEEVIDPTDSVRLIETYIRKSRIDIPVELPKSFKDEQTEQPLKVQRMTYRELNRIMDPGKNEKAKNVGQPSVMTITPNFIVIGTTMGMVRVFDYNQSPVKGLIAPSHKEAIGRAVTCVDVNRAGTHMVFGYDTGLIALWDIAKWSGQKLEAGVHTKPVLSVRFLGNDLKVVSADVGGDVKLIRFKKGFMGTSAIAKLALRERFIVSICLLESGPLSGSEAIADYVALVSRQGVKIANIGLTTKVIWGFKCPAAVKDAVPYADWSSSEEFGDDTSVLAIGCGRMIQLVSVNHHNLDYSTGYQEDGYYEVKKSIIGLKWLTGGVIAVLNAENELEIIHVSQFVPGVFKEYAKKKKKRFETIEEPNKIAGEVLPMHMEELKAEDEGGQLPRIYHHSVKALENDVFCLQRTGLFNGRLLTWDMYIEDQKETQPWKTCLRLYLEMYTGKYIGFSGLPIEDEMRKSLLKPNLKKYLLDLLSGEAKENQASIVIEVCLTLSSAEFLFAEMMSYYMEIEKEDAYVEAMEPYIMAGKFRSEYISDEFVGILLKQYNAKPEVLETLLLNLDLRDRQVKDLTHFCLTNKLFILYIYLMTIRDDAEEYLNPLQVLTQEFLKTKSKMSLSLSEIANYLQTNLIFQSKKQFEASSGYIGYLMVWYLDICFRWRKFPNPPNPDTAEESAKARPIILHTIVKWLCDFTPEEDKSQRKKDVVSQISSTPLGLMGLTNLTSLLKLMKQLFYDDETRNMLMNPSEYSVKKSEACDYSELFEKLEEIARALDKKDKSVKRNIEGECSRVTPYYKFLAQVASRPGVVIEPEKCIDVAKHLSDLTSELSEDLNEVKDVDRKEYETIIYEMLDNARNLSERQIDLLANVFSSRDYTKILIHLLERKGDYKKCFDTYLKSRDPHVQRLIFPWLLEIYNRVERDGASHKELKDGIYAQLERLVRFAGA